MADTPTATATPTGTASPTTPASPEEVAQLKAQLEQLSRTVAETNQRLSEKDRTIQDLNTTKAVLEARVTGTRQEVMPDPGDPALEAQASKILEEGLIDPQGAGKKLAALFAKAKNEGQQAALNNTMQNLQPAIELQVFETKMIEENKDLYDLGMKPAIEARAQELLSGKSNRTVQDIKEAVKTAINEKREKLKSLTTPKVPEPPATPPKGVSAEDGANVKLPLAQPAPNIQTQSEEIADVVNKRNKGLW